MCPECLSEEKPGKALINTKCGHKLCQKCYAELLNSVHHACKKCLSACTKTSESEGVTLYFGNRYEADESLTESPHRWCMLLSLNYDSKLTAKFITKVTYTLHD